MWSGRPLAKNQATTRPDQLWSEIWSSMSKVNEMKSSTGLSRHRSSTMRESWVASTLLIRMVRSSKKPSKKTVKSWKFQWKPQCPVCWRRSGTRKLVANPTKSKNQSMHAPYKLMNLRGSVWKGLCRKFMKITLLRRGSTCWVIVILCTVLSYAPAMKIPDAKAAVDKEWEKLEKLSAWQMTKVTSKRGGHPGSTERAMNSPFFPRWWTSVISRMRS